MPPSFRDDPNDYFAGLFRRPDLNAGSTYDMGLLSEFQRMFPDKGDDDISMRTFGIKAVMSLPFLGRHNGGQLFLRPASDLYQTYFKRVALRHLRRLGPLVVPEGRIAVDLHTHTCFSHDSVQDPAELLLAAARRGLAGIAVTDHNTLEGARTTAEVAVRLKREHRLPADFVVIPGEEISSSNGHVVGLFLTREVPTDLSVEATIQAIHDQGGLAVAAHPMLPDGLHDRALSASFDLVETENAAERLEFADARAGARERRDAFYRSVSRPRVGSSDGHDPATLGVCYTLLSCRPEPEAIRAALAAGGTEARSRLTDADFHRLMRRGEARGVLAFRKSTSLTLGLTRWLRRSTGFSYASVALFPRPGLTLSRRF